MKQIQVSIVTFALYLAFSLIDASVIQKQLDAENRQKFDSRAASWNCASDFDCTSAGSFCLSGNCVCPAGYIFNAAMTSCIKVVTAFGVACNETLQCSAYLLSGATCKNEVCSCGPGFHYVHGRCYPTSGLFESCNSDVNCYVNADPEASSCINGTCRCTEGWYQREYRTCRPAAYAPGDECFINKDCIFDDKARCSSDRICVLDGAAESTFQTRSTLSGHQNYLGSTKDIRIGSSCENDTDCDDIVNAECKLDKTCGCKRAHFASSTTPTSCIPELGEACTENDVVQISNSVCRNGTWRCTGATVSSVDNRICRKVTGNYGFSCLHNEQCYVFGPDSSCQNKRCVCNEGSHWVENEQFCWINRGINEDCRVNEDCYVEGSKVDLSCENFICTCPNGTHANSNETACVKDVTALDDPCETNDDCTISNSACLNGTCICNDPYYKLNDKCASGIGALCTTNVDCGPINSFCSSSSCACSYGYAAQSIDNCVAESSHGGECSHDIQCSSAMENTVCKNNTCACNFGYHYRFGRCFAKKALGESCSSLGECYLDSDVFMVDCLNGICKCGWDYSRVNDTSCRTSDATTIFASVWLGLAIFATRDFLSNLGAR